MSGEIVVPETPNWLKTLEDKREHRLKARLGHEAGAGAPCLKCGDKCPGLDLHFWRKACKICRCPKEEHDVHDDDIYGWAQFQLLGSKPNKIKTKIVLPGKKNEVELEWAPKGQKETIDKYLKTLPPEALPVKGSQAAQERKQMLQKQIPIHDIDPALCHELNEEEVKKMEEYIAHIKKSSVGVGQIVNLSNVIKANLHNISPQEAHIIASRYSKGVPFSEIVKLQSGLAKNLEKLTLNNPKTPKNKPGLPNMQPNKLGELVTDHDLQNPLIASKFKDITHPWYTDSSPHKSLSQPQYAHGFTTGQSDPKNPDYHPPDFSIDQKLLEGTNFDPSKTPSQFLGYHTPGYRPVQPGAPHPQSQYQNEEGIPYDKVFSRPQGNEIAVGSDVEKSKALQSDALEGQTEGLLYTTQNFKGYRPGEVENIEGFFNTGPNYAQNLHGDKNVPQSEQYGFENPYFNQSLPGKAPKHSTNTSNLTKVPEYSPNKYGPQVDTQDPKAPRSVKDLMYSTYDPSRGPLPEDNENNFRNKNIYPIDPGYDPNVTFNTYKHDPSVIKYENPQLLSKNNPAQPLEEKSFGPGISKNKGQGYIDPNTGNFVAGRGQGFIDPKTGNYVSGQGYIDPKTGNFVPSQGQGYIDPKTGNYVPGQGYIDPKTGNFVPGQGQDYIDPKTGNFVLGQGHGYIDPKTENFVPGQGYIDPKTGNFVPGQGQDYIDPKTGNFVPGQGHDYIDPKTGNFVPGQGQDYIDPKTGNFVPGQGHGYIDPKTGNFVPGQGYIDPKTGNFVPGQGQDYIDPKTGNFVPGQGHGYIDPKTGNFVPGQGYIDPKTGNFVPGLGQDYIDPKTGNFVPGQGHGYIDPKTGNFVPGRGQDYIDPKTGNFVPGQGYGYIDPKTGNFVPEQGIFDPGHLDYDPANPQSAYGAEFFDPKTGKFVGGDDYNPEDGSYDPRDDRKGNSDPKTGSGSSRPQDILGINNFYPNNAEIDQYSDSNFQNPNASLSRPRKPLSQLQPGQMNIPEDYLEPHMVNVGAIQDINPDVKAATTERNPGFDNESVYSDNGAEYSPESIREILNNIKLPDCHYCKKPFEENEYAITVERANVLFHAQCFKCAGCNQSLADNIYFYHKETDNVYCGRDYAKIKGYPRCAACDELIFTKEYCLAENSTFHLKHFCCFQCDTPLAGQEYTLEDEKPYCLPCYETSKAARCGTCENVIKPDEVGCQLNGVHFHAEDRCFRCIVCGMPLMGKKLLLRNEKLFCSHDCFNSVKK